MTSSDDDRFMHAALAEGGMPIAAGYVPPAGGGPGVSADRPPSNAENLMWSHGKRVRRTRLVRTERFVVAVEVDAVIPGTGPVEECCEPDVVELLREVEEKAKAGDVEWLKRRGKVYAALEPV